MSRVAVKKGNDDMEKELAGTVGGAAAGRLAGAAIGSIVPGVGTAIGGLLGGFLGGRVGDKITDAAGVGGKKTTSNVTDITSNATSGSDNTQAGQEDNAQQSATQRAGGAAMAVGQHFAQQQQMQQQNNQQMAEKAKQGSQIQTGEPMDMSWRLLKAWSFPNHFSDKEKEIIIQHAKKGKKYVSGRDIGHHDERFLERFEENQDMPKGAEKLTPKDLANAYMDLLLIENPDLLREMNQKLPPPDKKNFPNENFPGVRFEMLRTDMPKTTKEKGITTEWNSYTPVFAMGHENDEVSQLNPKAHLVSAVLSPIGTGAANRADLPVSHEFSYFNTEKKEKKYDFPHHMYSSNDNQISSQQRNKNTMAQISSSNVVPDFKELKRQGKISPTINRQAFGQRFVEGAFGGMNVPNLEEELNYLRGKQQKIENKKMLAQQEIEEKQRQQEEFMQTKPFVDFNGMMYFVTDPSKNYNQSMMDFNRVLSEGYINQDGSIKDEFKKSEAMDLAWALLKRELQLPLRLGEKIREDVMALDRQHKMVDNPDGTLIQNIHPDMENVVKLLTNMEADNQPVPTRPSRPAYLF